jgi:hypothetical protein
MVIAPKNAHGPGMLLMLTAVSAWILSIILIPNSRRQWRPSSNSG